MGEDEDDEMFYLDGVLSMGMQMCGGIRAVKTGSGLKWPKAQQKFLHQYERFLKGCTLSSEAFKSAKTYFLDSLFTISRKKITEKAVEEMAFSSLGLMAFFGFAAPDVDAFLVEGVNLASSFRVVKHQHQMSWSKMGNDCREQYLEWFGLQDTENITCLDRLRIEILDAVFDLSRHESVEHILTTGEAYTPPLSAADETTDGKEIEQLWRDIQIEEFSEDQYWLEVAEKK